MIIYLIFNFLIFKFKTMNECEEIFNITRFYNKFKETNNNFLQKESKNIT